MSDHNGAASEQEHKDGLEAGEFWASSVASELQRERLGRLVRRHRESKRGLVGFLAGAQASYDADEIVFFLADDRHVDVRDRDLDACEASIQFWTIALRGQTGP